MREPKAIFFDMDGTILDWQTGMDEHWRAACAAGCTDGAIDVDALFSAIVSRRTWFWADADRARAGRMDLDGSSRRIVRRALLDLGSDDEALAHGIADDYRSRRYAALVCYPGSIETLEELRRRGVRMALITNGAAASQRHSVERFGLARYFDCVVIEGEFGWGKPDERVFRHALTSCDVEPRETWMVGDSLEADIATPASLGMHTIWVNPAGGEPPSGAPLPHRTVRSISELLDATG